ncbi:MAG: DUF2892 domain-containing protein [Gemmatimonadaceae bacterium]|nr:DUF2892 domain-containing protein [Gemmatimonadaceae bacterium]
MFKNNVGGIDKVLRIVLGLGVLSLAFVGPKTPLGYLGLVPLATGLLGTCPLYSLLGFSTCPVKSAAR